MAENQEETAEPVICGGCGGHLRPCFTEKCSGLTLHVETGRHECDVVRVEYTIEPNWTHDHHRDVIEIPAAELAGLSPRARHLQIEKIVEEAVNNDCQWGWSELPS